MDEFGEGFPVAWCYSNREDSVILNNLVGNVHPELFKSDDASQYGVKCSKDSQKDCCAFGMLIELGIMLYQGLMNKNYRSVCITHSEF